MFRATPIATAPMVVAVPAAACPIDLAMPFPIGRDGHDLPPGDARGAFCLSRRRRNDRYRVLGWSGHHIPGLMIQADQGGPS